MQSVKEAEQFVKMHTLYLTTIAKLIAQKAEFLHWINCVGLYYFEQFYNHRCLCYTLKDITAMFTEAITIKSEVNIASRHEDNQETSIRDVSSY